MAVAPQINEDLFGTKIFTVIFTIRDSGDTTDRTDAGYLEVLSSGGATITGGGTYQITIEGTQPQVNTAMANLNYVPAADADENVGVSYEQTDDNGTGATGSNPFNDFMTMSIRDTHDEYSYDFPSTYNEDDVIGNFSIRIEDKRGITLPDLQYSVTVSVTNASIGQAPGESSAPEVSYTGTYTEVNAELEKLFINTVADGTSDITVTYTQTQTTDGITQADGELLATITGVSEQNFTTAQNLSTELFGTNYWDIGAITDTRSDNFQGIVYEVSLTVDPSHGYFLGNTTITGTKEQVNEILSNMTFIAKADSDFTINYKQTQTTDGVIQADENINVTYIPINWVSDSAFNDEDDVVGELFDIDTNDLGEWIVASAQNQLLMKIYENDYWGVLLNTQFTPRGVTFKHISDSFAYVGGTKLVTKIGSRYEQTDIQEIYNPDTAPDITMNRVSENNGNWIAGGIRNASEAETGYLFIKSNDPDSEWEKGGLIGSTGNADVSDIHYRYGTAMVTTEGPLGRSTDNGNTFDQVSYDSGMRSVSSNSSGVVVYVSDSEIHRSTDGGITWGLVHGDGGNSIDTDDSGTWIVSTNNNTNLISYDDGETFVTTDNISDSKNFTVNRIRCDRTNGQWYAVGTGGSIFKTTINKQQGA